jgi:signal transduction histidine kinase
LNRRPGARFGSIAARLVLSGAFLSFAILLAAGIVLSAVYRAQSEAAFDGRLHVYLKALVADVAAFGENDRSEPGNLGEPRFELPLSGWYWQIAQIDTDRDSQQTLKTSKSLFAARLPRLSELGVPPRANGVSEAYAVGPDNRPVRLIERTIDLGDDGRYAISIAGDASEIESEVTRFNTALFLTFLLLAVALALSSIAQVRFGLKPLVDVRQALGQIRRGEKQHIDGAFPSEIAPLASEINQLVDANRDIIERARTQVGNLAHALKTPLSVMVNEAEGSDTLLAGKVLEQTSVMKDQVQFYLDRARAAARAAAIGTVTDVEPVVAGLLRAFTKICRDRGIAFEASGLEGLRFKGEKQDLEEMAGNLIDNAGKWASAAVSVSAESGPDLGEERPSFALIIDDDGPGLPPDKREEATRRGRRLDETKPGSGLGLSIVVDLAQLYGGQLKLEDSPKGGLRARLVLPAVLPTA